MARLPGLLRYAVVLTGDQDLAQDIVQEVLARAQRVPVVAAHLGGTVRHVHVAGERLVELDDARGRVDDHAQGVVDADALWRRLATLGRKQRAVLVPRYYEQLEDEQIADLLVELLLDRCLAAEPFPLPPADPAVAVDALLWAAAGMVSKQDRTGRGTRRPAKAARKGLLRR